MFRLTDLETNPCQPHTHNRPPAGLCILDVGQCPHRVGAATGFRAPPIEVAISKR